MVIICVLLSVVVVGSISLWCWRRRKRLKEVKVAGERREQEQKEREQGEDDEKPNYAMTVPFRVDNGRHSEML